MQDLHLEIKQLIIDSLNLEGLTPDDIDSQAPLFGDGLGLDSIDALELGLPETVRDYQRCIRAAFAPT